MSLRRPETLKNLLRSSQFCLFDRVYVNIHPISEGETMKDRFGLKKILLLAVCFPATEQFSSFQFFHARTLISFKFESKISVSSFPCYICYRVKALNDVLSRSLKVEKPIMAVCSKGGKLSTKIQNFTHKQTQAQQFEEKKQILNCF